MRTFFTAVLLTSCMSFLPLAAQSSGEDLVKQQVFPPELVMQHQQALALSDDQRQAIKEEVQTAQSVFTNLQWDIQSEMEKFVTMLSDKRIDEKTALLQLDKILDLEGQIKRRQLTLAIRIKNLLTPAQQSKLTAIRDNGRDGQSG